MKNLVKNDQGVIAFGFVFVLVIIMLFCTALYNIMTDQAAVRMHCQDWSEVKAITDVKYGSTAYIDTKGRSFLKVHEIYHVGSKFCLKWTE